MAEPTLAKPDFYDVIQVTIIDRKREVIVLK